MQLSALPVLSVIDDADGYGAHCLPPDIWGDWSLKNLYSQEDAGKNPSFSRRLAYALRNFAGHRVYAPSVAYHSGAILEDESELDAVISLPDRVRLHRNREVRADGLFLNRGSSFIMSAAGCLVVVATGGGELIASHASRESLLDRSLIERETPSREHESVVGAIVAAMEVRGVHASEIRLRGYFGVKGEHLAHPFADGSHGAYNRAMAAYVSDRWGADCVDVIGPEGGEIAYLDLNMLLMHQADELGVPDAECSHSLPADGVFANTRHAVPKLREMRNLCIVHSYR